MPKPRHEANGLQELKANRIERCISHRDLSLPNRDGRDENNDQHFSPLRPHRYFLPLFGHASLTQPSSTSQKSPTRDLHWLKDIHEDPDVEKIFNEVKEAGETLQKAVEIVPKDWDTLSILIREREQLNKALVEKLRENCGMMTVRGERIDPFSKDKTPCVQAKMWGEHNLGLMLQRINRLLNKYDNLTGLIKHEDTLKSVVSGFTGVQTNEEMAVNKDDWKQEDWEGVTERAQRYKDYLWSVGRLLDLNKPAKKILMGIYQA
ncbi:MAG: hypothetical protein L6R40_005721 [Gallowayella cf. fulva]|nr:MAG: hypothetical protein L6R40_005721 [Xanthomendoza cf. fulva]